MIAKHLAETVTAVTHDHVEGIKVRFASTSSETTIRWILRLMISVQHTISTKLVKRPFRSRFSVFMKLIQLKILFVLPFLWVVTVTPLQQSHVRLPKLTMVYRKI